MDAKACICADRRHRRHDLTACSRARDIWTLQRGSLGIIGGLKTVLEPQLLDWSIFKCPHFLQHYHTMYDSVECLHGDRNKRVAHYRARREASCIHVSPSNDRPSARMLFDKRCRWRKQCIPFSIQAILVSRKILQRCSALKAFADPEESLPGHLQ